MNTQLYRSTTDQMIGGVCGGLARYLNLDVSLIRIFFVLLAFADGAGVMIYLILWLVLPADDHVAGGRTGDYVRNNAEGMADRARELGRDVRRAASTSHPRANLIIGAALVIAGILFLIENLNIAWLSWLRFGNLWPVLLIVGGIALLVRGTKGE